MSNKKPQTLTFLGRSSFHRINFLYQACNLVHSASNEEAKRILNSHYGQILSKVAKKSVLRMDISMKRNLCKGCGTVFIAPNCSVHKSKKNKGPVKITCKNCMTEKSVGSAATKKIWHLKDESIYEEFEDKYVETEIVKTVDH